jgi:hypothetical protein
MQPTSSSLATGSQRGHNTSPAGRKKSQALRKGLTPIWDHKEEGETLPDETLPQRQQTLSVSYRNLFMSILAAGVDTERTP